MKCSVSLSEAVRTFIAVKQEQRLNLIKSVSISQACLLRFLYFSKYSLVINYLHKMSSCGVFGVTSRPNRLLVGTLPTYISMGLEYCRYAIFSLD